MLNFRIVSKILSSALIIAGLFMLLSALVAILYDDPSGSLFISGIITAVTGGMVYSPSKNDDKIYGTKEGFVIVTGIWLCISLMGTLPYLLSGTIHNFGNALFESVSGFTTTGATIIEDIDSCSHGIIFWRSATQWIGGLTFILVTLSVFHIKRTNIQFSIDDFSVLPQEKINPRTNETAKRLIAVYVSLTLIETCMLLFGGLNLFEALNLSMSTVSTGGFSFTNNSIASFDSPYILIILTLFMFLAGTNTSLIYYGSQKRFNKMKNNEEFRFYAFICIGFTMTGTAVLLLNNSFNFPESLLESAFQTISMASTTGFYNTNYHTWGIIMEISFIILMMIGACVGSAGSGIKCIRILLVGKIMSKQAKNAIHPNAVLPIRIDGKIIPHQMIINALAFVMLYIFTIFTGTTIITLFGYDIPGSLSLTVSMLGNVGTAPGTSGIFSLYSPLPMSLKLFLIFLMLLGRVELFALLIFFFIGFYKR